MRFFVLFGGCGVHPYVRCDVLGAQSSDLSDVLGAQSSDLSDVFGAQPVAQRVSSCGPSFSPVVLP